MGERYPDRRIGGVARDLKSQGGASLVFLYGVTPPSWAALQKSHGWRNMGMKPVIPLRPGAGSGVLILTRFEVLRSTDESFSGQNPSICIREATVACPGGGEISFAAPSDSDFGGSDCVGRAAQLLEWLASGQRRICVADFGVEGTDADANNLAAEHCGCIDIWAELHPEEPGYTYDGKLNMSDEKNTRRRNFRLFCTPDLFPFAPRMSTVGLSPVKGAKVATRGGLKEHKLHPSSRYGLAADFVFGGRRPPQPADGLIKIPPISAPIQSIPIGEARALRKANFADRGVDAKAIRLALRRLGACPPADRSLAATFAMFRIALPDRAAWSKKCKKADLKASLRHLRLPLAGNKPRLVERISNAFSITVSPGGVGQASQDIAGESLGSAPLAPPAAGFDVGNEGAGHSRPHVPCLDDSIAAGKKPSNPARARQQSKSLSG